MMQRQYGRRGLSARETKLWKSVTRDVAPIKGRAASGAQVPDYVKTGDVAPIKGRAASGAQVPDYVKTGDVAPIKGRAASGGKTIPPAAPENVPPPKRKRIDCAPKAVWQRPPPSLTGLDRGIRKRLVRGHIQPECVLDLHGYTRHSGYDRLYPFLEQAQGEGVRCALVITGKGDSPAGCPPLHSRDFSPVPERKSVLRNLLPLWMNETRFRALVAGFQPAHPRHGGGGAFYIWLRRRR